MTALTFRLPVRAPFDGAGLLEFLAHRAVAGVEYVTGSTYARTLRLPGGPATVDLQLDERDDPAAVTVRLRLTDPGDASEALERCRRLVDADADATAIAAVLAADPLLAPAVAQHPGARLPGAVDGAEIVVRALIGQQISVAAARTTLGRLTAAAGEPIDTGDPRLTHVFPSSAALAALEPAAVGGRADGSTPCWPHPVIWPRARCWCTRAGRRRSSPPSWSPARGSVRGRPGMSACGCWARPTYCWTVTLPSGRAPGGSASHPMRDPWPSTPSGGGHSVPMPGSCSGGWPRSGEPATSGALSGVGSMLARWTSPY